MTLLAAQRSPKIPSEADQTPAFQVCSSNLFSDNALCAGRPQKRFPEALAKHKKVANVMESGVHGTICGNCDHWHSSARTLGSASFFLVATRQCTPPIFEITPPTWRSITSLQINQHSHHHSKNLTALVLVKVEASLGGELGEGLHKTQT
jgi:hypothetical protein